VTSGSVASLLVDTDVFVDHLRGSRRLAPGGDTYAYSVVTRCELFAGRGSDENAVRRLLAPFREIAVDRSVAERAGRIRREVGIRTPDALIAAAALANRLTLLTRNTRDFEGVPGLKIRSPER
jgi:predicted nucleic acid-binding protein